MELPTLGLTIQQHSSTISQLVKEYIRLTYTVGPLNMQIKNRKKHMFELVVVPTAKKKIEKIDADYLFFGSDI